MYKICETLTLMIGTPKLIPVFSGRHSLQQYLGSFPVTDSQVFLSKHVLFVIFSFFFVKYSSMQKINTWRARNKQ